MREALPSGSYHNPLYLIEADSIATPVAKADHARQAQTPEETVGG